jgi:hypothetical protein
MDRRTQVFFKMAESRNTDPKVENAIKFRKLKHKVQK